LRTATGDLLDDIGGVVDIVAVVAAKPLHRVDAAGAIEDIGSRIADDGLGDFVAGQINRARAAVVRRREKLDRNPGGEPIGRRVRREAPWFMRTFYKLFYVLFNRLSYVPMPRDAGDFSLIDRKVVRWILACQERDLFLESGIPGSALIVKANHVEERA